MAKKSLLIPLLIAKLSGVLALVLQLHGILMLWAIYQKYAMDRFVTFQLRKRNSFLRKTRQARERNLRRKKRECWYYPGRTEQWWQKMLDGEAPEDTWRKNFRLPRDEFQKLLDELRPYISPNPKSPNYRALTAEKKLATTLYYLKDTGSLQMTANSFGLSVPTVSSVLFEVCMTISTILGPKYIHLPQDDSEMMRKVAEFEGKFGMVQAFGCVDGTHIAIKRPKESSQDYYSYKGFHSINVQGVCDFRGIFMDVDCRWPGSVHDAKVFANSEVSKGLRNGKLPITYQTVIPGYEKVPNYLIGDPAYPLIPYCLKEYDTCDTNEKVIFNNLLRAARNPVECAFGRLKARWAVLTKKVDLDIKTVPTMVYACFVLHNICEKNNTSIDEELVRSQIQVAAAAQDKEIPDPVYSCNSNEGETVRDTSTKYVGLNLPDHLTS